MGSTQGNVWKEEETEEDRSERREQGRKGFLRPESPRMQGKQEVGLVMCVISTL